MKLNIPKENYTSLSEEQKAELKNYYNYNTADRCWHSRKDIDYDTAFAVSEKVGIYPTVSFAPTKEEYNSFSLEKKMKIKELFYWNKKMSMWESKELLGKVAFDYLLSEGHSPSCDVEDTLAIKLREGIKAMKSSDDYKRWLYSMSRFTAYSPNNMILIALQNPNATLIAGKAKWWNDFKRNPNPDAKGLYILAPKIYNKPLVKDEEELKKLESGEIKEKDLPHKKVITGFMPVKVYDVSETHGEPLPEIPMKKLTDKVENYEQLKAAIIKTAAPYTVSFKAPQEMTDPSANGLCYYQQKCIEIRNNLSEAQTIKTMLHELSHSRLHDVDFNPDADSIPRYLREMQAESTAFIMAQKYGIDASDYSFGYVSSWSESSSVQALHSALTVAAEQSHELSRSIDSYLEQDITYSNSYSNQTPQSSAVNFDMELKMI